MSFTLYLTNNSLNDCYLSVAKKIPIEHILAAGGGVRRPGAPGGRSGNAQEGAVNLEENANKPKDACNC